MFSECPGQVKLARTVLRYDVQCKDGKTTVVRRGEDVDASPLLDP